MTAATFFIKTYGCSMNVNDSEVMAGLLSSHGYKLVDSINDAQIVIVNTCGVKLPTEHRVLSYLSKLNKLTDKKIIVAGCLPKMTLEKIKRAIPNYSAIIGPNGIYDIVDIVRRITTSSNEKIILLDSPLNENRLLLPTYRFSKVSAIVPISQGCLGACTYCSVKFARGNLRSFPLQHIVHQVDSLVSTGYKEIWITSEDVGVYGADIGLTIVDLLNKLIELDGNFRLRVGMMNPASILHFYDELAEVFKDAHIYKFLHLPVQSGSDKILSLMRRFYTVQDFIDIVNTFRKKNPRITISTDIIVGFPGETDEDFALTLDLIENIKPDLVNISKYGDRPNTVASKMPNHVPSKIIKMRSRILTKKVLEISYNINKTWIGWSGDVLFSEVGDRGEMIGRNYTYKPIVLREFDGQNIFGEIKKIKIVDNGANYLVGVLE